MTESDRTPSHMPSRWNAAERLLVGMNLLIVGIAGFVLLSPGGLLGRRITAWRESRQVSSYLRSNWASISAAGDRLDAGSSPVRIVEFSISVPTVGNCLLPWILSSWITPTLACCTVITHSQFILQLMVPHVPRFVQHGRANLGRCTMRCLPSQRGSKGVGGRPSQVPLAWRT